MGCNDIRKTMGDLYRFLKKISLKTFKCAVDNMMQQRTRDGIGTNKQQVDIVSIAQENYLWEKGFLGSQDDKHLLNAVLWILGINFGLRGGHDHRN